MKWQHMSRGYELDPKEQKKFEAGLASLRKLVKSFPAAELRTYIDVLPRRKLFHVRSALHLTRRTLFAAERAQILQLAFERCVRNLMDKAKGYKEQLQGRAEFRNSKKNARERKNG